MGPDQLSRGPPGRPLERKTHLWRPSLSLPGKPIGLSLKKTFVFEKIAKTTINVRSGASWEKRAALQNRVFRFLGASWSPPEPEPFRSRPPPELPKAPLELPGPPQILPRAPGSSKGPYQIHKVGMLKTLEICVFGLQGNLKKTFPDDFFTLRGSLGDLPEWRPRSSKALLGAKKAPLECSGTPQRSLMSYVTL